MLKIATWNVNSVKARLGHLLDYIDGGHADVLLLQELKCPTDDFPLLEIEARKWHAAVLGQKTYNGVAILSREPIAHIHRGLPGDRSDEQARYIEGTVGDVRVASLYLPNGNPVDSDKFSYKLAWMERLYAHARRLLMEDQPFVLGGDYNVCPTDTDAYDPAAWANDALCRPESRSALRKILHLGLTDALRALHPRARLYTYWDYQQNRWAKDEGLRIDHLLLSPQAADRLDSAGVDRGPRAKDKASDHTPAWIRLR